MLGSTRKSGFKICNEEIDQMTQGNNQCKRNTSDKNQ